MKLSVKSEYALLALIYLANKSKKELINAREISENMEIPKKYLEQILLSMKRAGFISSRKGLDGGYALAKEAKEISLAEIIRLMDGALAPISSVSKYFYESTPSEKSKKLIRVFKEIRNYISNKMEKTTLHDIS